MSLSLSIDELIGYTNGERAKWEAWFQEHPPSALDAPVQREGDFSDVWRLMHHIFRVEKRHTQRLKQESPLMEQIGVARHDVTALFAFGRTVREELTGFIHSASQADLNRTLEVSYRNQVTKFTARKLVFHIFVHEIRHWAQIATAVRNAGFPPPGLHDLLFSDAME
ncbi:MAG: DinB family protein [Acidobacteriia bacterium]|nr:DinB family protein [Terriglobia bacterium]